MVLHSKEKGLFYFKVSYIYIVLVDIVDIDIIEETDFFLITGK